MRYSSKVIPISYLKANAAEVLEQLGEQQEPMLITQNGEAKAVIQDVQSYEQTQETLALLRILALGNQEIEAGKLSPLKDVARRLRARGKIEEWVKHPPSAERDLESLQDSIAALEHLLESIRNQVGGSF